jgi:hypothetical protein
VATLCRVSTSSTGQSRVSTATFHATAVSFASQGRITMTFGIARRFASCSTGWCVGPSSPSAMLSWVKTWTTCRPISAASRIGGRI